MTTTRIRWNDVLPRAADIVTSYDTPVTLRQLFYRLVSELLIPNTRSAYQNLSRLSAEARRRGEFPSLMDRTRTIHEFQTFAGPEQARRWLSRIYRRDRTEAQPWTVYLGVEKAGIVEQLSDWFGGPLGLPVLALGGYSSQTYADEVFRHVMEQGRESVLLYAGDFDPSGEDIGRDFVARSRGFDVVRRIALTAEQVEEYELPPQPGKEADSRAAAFVARHGRLVQVELDALPPETLRELFQEAIDEFFDTSTYEAVMEREEEERAELEGGPDA